MNRELINKLSANRRILGIIAIFVLLGFSIVVLEVFGNKITTGVRGYVYGEGKWAKAQKQASIELSAYVYNNNEVHYRNFKEHLSIHEGDRIAREELLSESPDLEVVTDGFLRGGNQPEDIPDMIWLLSNFQNWPQINDALGYWIEGDEKIAELRNLGLEVHQQVEAGTLNETNVREYFRQIMLLDDELTVLENNFSEAMSDAARSTSRILFWSTILVSISFILIAAILSVSFMRNLKRTNEMLGASEAKFRNVLDNSRDVIYQYRKGQKEYDYMSRSVEDMLGYSYETVKNGGQDFILQLLHPEDKERMQQVADSLEEDGVSDKLPDTEFRVKKADGSYIWINNKRAPILNEKGEVEAVVGNVRDISDRKRRMQKIDKSLKEKQVLLSEIHHRVKNNLAIVSSLIELKKWEMNEEQKVEFNELQSRIKSIALVHEKLYSGDTLSEVELSDYLEDLGDMILKTFNSTEKEIDIEYELDSAYVEIDRAVPIGLICNELINNSFKHGFGEEESGKIGISMKRGGDTLVLTVFDSAGKLPEGFSVDKHSTLGMTIIKRLIRQLDGELEVSTGEKSVFSITFPLNKNRGD